VIPVLTGSGSNITPQNPTAVARAGCVRCRSLPREGAIVLDCEGLSKLVNDHAPVVVVPGRSGLPRGSAPPRSEPDAGRLSPESRVIRPQPLKTERPAGKMAS
jgi:hypothetical protein